MSFFYANDAESSLCKNKTQTGIFLYKIGKIVFLQKRHANKVFFNAEAEWYVFQEYNFFACIPKTHLSRIFRTICVVLGSSVHLMVFFLKRRKACGFSFQDIKKSKSF